MHVLRKLALLLVLPALVACPLSSTDDDPDPASPDALVGFWQYTIQGDVETTLRFSNDGTFRVLDAFVGAGRCDTEGGWWEAAEGVITYGVTEVNGEPASESGTVPYAISGNTLTLDPGNADEEVFGRADGPMPTCGDYGFPSLVVFEATIGGVFYDFTDPGPNPVNELGMSLGALAQTGALDLTGRIGGSAYPCPSCQTLQMTLLGGGSSGTIVPGTYVRGGTVGPGDAGDALIVYTTSVAVQVDPSQVFWSGLDAVTGSQEGSVTVTVTVVEENRIAGTFETTMWSGDMLTSLTASGRFDLRYD